MGRIFTYFSLILVIINLLVYGEASNYCSLPWNITIDEDFNVKWFGEDRDANVILQVKPINVSDAACPSFEISEKFDTYEKSYHPCQNTLYSVDIKLQCTNGDVYPKPAIFWPPKTDPEAPSDLTAFDVTNTTLKLQWKKPAHTKEPIVLYYVLKSKVGNFASGETIPVTGTSYEVAGLFAYTNYYFKVRTKSEKRDGPWSQALDVITDIGVPFSPLSIGTSVTNSSIELWWDPPNPSRGPILWYTVKWGTSMEFLEEEFRIVNETRYEIKDLAQYTEYFIQIQATTAAGDGPWSVMVSNRTGIGVPSVPVNLRKINVTSSSIELAWEAPETPNGPLLEYVVSWGVRGTPVVQELVKNSTKIFEDLTPFTEYSFQIAAQTEAGTGPYTSRLCVRTKVDVPGFPRNLTATHVTNTTISLEWITPKVTNGPILGYVVHFWSYTFYDENDNEMETNSTTFLLKDLTHSTNYTIEVCALTAAGRGPWSDELNVTTEIGVPYAIQNLSTEIMATSLQLHWLPSQKEPSFTSDFLIAWGIVGTVASEVITTDASYEPLGLRPYTEYFFHIVPRNEAGAGPSTDIIIRTNIAVPTTPRDLAVVDATDTSLFLEWSPPEHPNGPNLEYTILWSTTSINSSAEAVVNKTRYRIENLESSTNYSLQVAANNTAGEGPWSVELIGRTKDRKGQSKSLSLPLALGIGLVLPLLVILLCAIAYAIKKGALDFSRYKRPRKPPPMQNGSVSLPNPIMQLEVVAPTKKSITIHNFEEYMKNTKRYDFTKEFEELRKKSPHESCDAAKLDENLIKNRWVKILPFDHSRVKILPNEGELRSNFINANYVPGDAYLLEYIATQGPLPNTLNDFWLMVWQQSVSMIVILTQCVERAVKNCEKYWPSSGEKKTYGEIQVETMSESILTSYVQRVFTVQYRNQRRHVVHMHFTNWPVQGCPRSPDEFLHFMRKVRDQVSERRPGPILVHCSAGAGRTGTYIAVDRVQQHLQHSEDIDIFDTVLDMRRFRAHMVHTEDQYIFIYSCIQRLLQEGNQPENIYEIPN